MAHFMWVSGQAALKPLCRRESVSRPVSLPDQTHIHLCLPGCWWPLLSGVELTFTLASVNSLALHPRPPSLCGQSQESVLARDDDEHLGELHQCASQSQRVHTEGFNEAIKLPKFHTAVVFLCSAWATRRRERVCGRFWQGTVATTGFLAERCAPFGHRL